MHTDHTPPEVSWHGEMPLSAWLRLHYDHRFHAAASRLHENQSEPSYNRKGFIDRPSPRKRRGDEPIRRTRLS